MINLNDTNIAVAQDSGFHIDSKLVAIHGINVDSDKNLKSTVYEILNTTQIKLKVVGDWTGYVGFINVNDEIMYVSATNFLTTYTELTVLRSQYGTVARFHINGQYVYTIDIFKNVISYEWAQSIGVNDRDLFTTEISNGRIVLDDLPQNWNKLYSEKLYNFKRNKEVFIWEGCNGELVKVWEGLTVNKNDSSENNEITIETADYLNKFADEPISPVKIFNDIRPKELIESLLTGFTGVYVGNTTVEDYFKIFNLCTSDFATYREFLNYICKEYAIRLLFRKDKTIHISSDIYPNKITPVATIEKELIKINNDSSGNIIINNVTGTYKERKPMKDTSYTSIRFRRPQTPMQFNISTPIISGGQFQPITLTGLSYTDISTMSYQEYQMLEDTLTNKTYMCKLVDIAKISEGNYTITLYAGIDKPSKWNELGRMVLEGDITLTSFTLHWSYDELPIVWKYGRNIDGEDSTANLMFPIFPDENYEFYIDSFGVANTATANFSGIINGFDALVGTTYDNTSLFYNQEYKQNATVPIYLYSNKIATTLTDDKGIICIGSIDNSNITFKIDYSDIKDTLYKCTIDNTLTKTTTTEITPSQTLNGQRLLKLLEDDYNACNIGDAFKLKEVEATDTKYQTYLSFKEARYLITSKFIDGTDYYISINDYFPMAVGTEYTFVKYKRDEIILLNELYFRANPIMEVETSYDFTHDDSIEEFGKKDYTIEGKSIQKDDFLKITNYLKETYNGVTEHGIRNKIRSEIMRRVDLEAGDVVSITDSVYTQYNNQKALITKKEVKVDNNGMRDENYEMLTIGDYEISPELLANRNIITWSPDVVPQYNHNSTEGTANQTDGKNIDNKRVVLQDAVEGQIYVEEISIATFKALTSVTSSITSDIKTFELNMTGLSTGDYRNALLGIDKEGIIKVNNEYLSYKSLGYVDVTNTASIQIIKRGIANSTQSDICSGLTIQFYNILAKLSANGLESTEVLIGDNVKNTLKLSSSEDSYLNMNDGEQQMGVVSGVTKTSVLVPDFNGFFFGDKEIDNKNHFYYNISNSLAVFNGKYFNGTAYCYTPVDLIGALDTGILNILNNGIPRQNIFYGLRVDTIILMDTTEFDLSGLNPEHFSSIDPIYKNYIVPSSSINEITSIYGYSQSKINFGNIFGLYLDYPTKISNITLYNIGSTEEISGERYGIYVATDNCSFSDLALNTSHLIYGGAYINQIWNNIIINNYTASSIETQTIKSIFYKCHNIDNIVVNTENSFISETTSIFYQCVNISKTYLYNRDINYKKMSLFRMCKRINDIYISMSPSSIFYECDNINNIEINLTLDMISRTDNIYLFETSKRISNLSILNYVYYNKYFYSCLYLNNIEAQTDGTQNYNLLKVDTNTVSWT